METLTSSEEELLRRVRSQPVLLERFNRLLSLVENSEGDIIRADDAEMRVTEGLRQMGNELLTAWAERRVTSEAAAPEVKEGYSRVGKKNSGGTAPTV